MIAARGALHQATQPTSMSLLARIRRACPHHPMRAYPGRIIFDHFAKTGGQAINAWLVGALGTACVTPNVISEHRRAIRQLGGSYSVISGHITFDPGDRLDPRYRYITLLREPVDRVVSWIYYLLHHVDPAGMSAPLVRGAREFLDSDGLRCAPEFRDSVSNLVVEHFCKLGDGTPGSDADKLARALDAIAAYDIVGRYDRMEEFAARVAALIGIPPPPEVPRTNVTRERPAVDALSPALRLGIEALCPLDVALYRTLTAHAPRAAADAGTGGVGRPAAPAWDRYDRVARDLAEPGIALSFVAGPPGEQAQAGQRIELAADVDLAREVADLVVGVHIHDGYGNWAFGTNTQLLGQRHARLPRGRYRVTFSVLAQLPLGRYSVGFAVNDDRPEGVLPLVWYDELGQFEVTPAPSEPFAGYAYLHPRVVVEPVA